MLKSLLILLSILILNSCYSENIVGKKILCVRSDNSQKFEDVRSYEFISEAQLVRTFMWFDESLDSSLNNFVGEKWGYKLTSNTIEVYLNKEKISEIINRKNLSINMPWDQSKDWNFKEGECKMIRGDISEKMIKIYNNQNAKNKISFFNRINNFFDKFLYKI
tara:strand:- start:251 stop:739 length:489 start_codon:yes stop_codon:yes gene_type:complete